MLDGLRENRFKSDPDQLGHFGVYGGRFVPETLMHPLEELTSAFMTSRDDPEFHHKGRSRYHPPQARLGP